MEFEFNHQLIPQNLIDIEEVGQFGLEAWNDTGYYYYMLVRTMLGTSVIATCGPVFPDIDVLPSGYSSAITKIPFREDKLAKTISFFLNDKHKCITEAKLITFEDGIRQFRDIGPYLENLREDTF